MGASVDAHGVYRLCAPASPKRPLVPDDERNAFIEGVSLDRLARSALGQVSDNFIRRQFNAVDVSARAPETDEWVSGLSALSKALGAGLLPNDGHASALAACAHAHATIAADNRLLGAQAEVLYVSFSQFMKKYVERISAPQSRKPGCPSFWWCTICRGCPS